jgi:2-oxoglutarate dehydrogenase E2 component (dihydrolipoamide succinyltransferase)
MAVDVVMPQLGESVVEGTITRWLVKEGGAIQKDQPLVTISTDKADTDVPSPTSGVVVKLAVAEGETVKVNTVIAVIDAAATASAPAAAATPAAPAAPAASDPGGQTSPAVRSLAREHNVDLSTLRGTGENGRVTKQDVLDAASKKPAAPAPIAAPMPVAAPVAAPSRVESANAVIQAASAVSYGAPTKTFKVPAYVPQPGDEVVPFSRRRRIIADHMVYSKHVSPHVYTFAEIDMHKVHKLRETKKDALKAQGSTSRTSPSSLRRRRARCERTPCSTRACSTTRTSSSSASTSGSPSRPRTASSSPSFATPTSSR